MDEYVPQHEQEQLRQEQDRQREELIRRMCTPEALERLRRVKLVKRELVEHIERLLEQQARAGKIRSQVQEQDIIDLLNRAGEAASSVEKIVISRKKYADDDDDDSDSDLK